MGVCSVFGNDVEEYYNSWVASAPITIAFVLSASSQLLPEHAGGAML